MIRPVNPGDPVPPLEWWQAVYRGLKRAMRITTVPPLRMDTTGPVRTVAINPAVRIMAQITAAVSGGYSWQEVGFDGGVWTVVPGGRTGTANAYELNGRSVPIGAVVELFPGANNGAV